jgi:FkbM family methyltransferase
MYAQFKRHPLTSRRPVRAFMNFIRWQIGARILRKKVIIPWVDDAQLVLGIGEAGLSINLYYGLGEFEDMLFLMHTLRHDETFVDIGANLGAYTILASKICKAKSISFEPVPQTAERLKTQIRINAIENHVRIENKGVGNQTGTLAFSNNLDTTNHVVLDASAEDTVRVDVVTIDTELDGTQTYIFKIDVEGYEHFVIEGAKKILSSQNTSALIIEINKSAEEFGFSNHDIHNAICALGFQAVAYDPFARNLTPIGNYNEKGGNTIYVKDVIAMAERCRTAPKRKIHTANGVIL